MKLRVRIFLISAAIVAMLFLADCGHYNCGVTFGSSSSCTSSGSGFGTSTGPTSSTGAFVFVADAAGTGTTGTIDGYVLDSGLSTFGPTSSYTPPTTPLADSGVGMVVAQKQFLYTAFPSTSQIFGWTISSTGSLTPISGTPLAAPFVAFMASGFGTQKIITNPAGTLLFFADTFQDKIYVYKIGSSGTLTAASGSPFSVPFSPGNLATDGLGKYLYITETFSNHTGSEVGAYGIGSGGSLTAVPGSPFSFPMWQVQGEPSGKYLVGTTGNSAAAGFSGLDDDNLYVFGITQTGANAGAIAEVSGSPFATEFSPLDLAVQSNTNGNLVYTFGINDQSLAFNDVEGYAIGSGGTLSLAAGSPFSNAAVGDLGALDQSGSFLFVYGGVFNINTDTITYQMGAFDVGSGGTLSEPTSTLTLTSGGFFAVTDPQ